MAHPASVTQTVLNVLLLVFVVVSFCLLTINIAAPERRGVGPICGSEADVPAPSQQFQQIPSGRWLVIGTGLSAATVVQAMDAPLRASTGLREASSRFGGRVLTTLQPAVPVSTNAQAFEFGMWAADPQLHTSVLQTLQALQMPTVTQYINYSASFMYTHGTFASLPPVPTPARAQLTAAYASLDSVEAAAWFAHTGLAVADAPTAAIGSLVNLLLPETCIVPAGLGWQSVVLRAIGLTPVQYNQRVVQIDSHDASASKTPSSSLQTLTVHYAAGQTEIVQGVVLTCAVNELQAIAGVLPSVHQTIQRALTPVAQGVLIATWAAQDVWWPAIGFIHALAATDTQLGHIVTVDSTSLRCFITAAADINAWSSMIVTDGVPAAARAIATILKTIFPSAHVMPPAHVTFRGWPASMWLWTAGTDAAQAATLLSRPFGPHVPVWWTSSDIAPAFQNRAEGAFRGGQQVATAIASYIASTN